MRIEQKIQVTEYWLALHCPALQWHQCGDFWEDAGRDGHTDIGAERLFLKNIILDIEQTNGILLS